MKSEIRGERSVAINIHKSSVFELWKEAGRPVDVKVEGASMLPLIRPGDIVSLCLINVNELKTGDLIAFRQNGNLIVHRFIRRQNIDKSVWLCQKGDNLSGWSWIPEDGVVGKVESVRGQGKQIDINTRPWTWINRVMGILGFFWVSAVGKARLLKESIAPGRQLPVLGGLVSRMGWVFNSTCGFVIIKTIEGREKRA